MKLEDWNRPGSFPDLEGPALAEALAELCERRQSLFLATPYLTFASRFLGQDGPDLRIRATMSRSVAQHTLKDKPLSLRFPWGLTLYGGATKVLEYRQEETGKELRVSLPARFARADQRRAYRAERTGRSPGTLGIPDDSLTGMAFVRFNVDNLSTSGIGVFCTDPLPKGLTPGRRLNLEFALERGPELRLQGQLVHLSGQNLGLAFAPPPDPADLDRLSTWLQPRLDEDLRRWEARATLRAQAERAAAPRPAPSGVLLVSADPDLLREVGTALEGALDVRAVPPVLAPYKDALDLQPPALVLLPCSGSLDECHRLKALVDKVRPACPLAVVATAGPAALRSFAQEVRATLTTDRPRLRPLFFRRLALGLIRKYVQTSE